MSALKEYLLSKTAMDRFMTDLAGTAIGAGQGLAMNYLTGSHHPWLAAGAGAATGLAGTELIHHLKPPAPEQPMTDELTSAQKLYANIRAYDSLEANRQLISPWQANPGDPRWGNTLRTY